METMADEDEVWREYRLTGERRLRESLILRYAPLVKYVVGRMAIALPPVLAAEDILSQATIGLINAIERYEPERGLKFETFAVPRIRGSVLDCLRRLGTYPRGSRKKLRDIQAAIAVLEEAHGRVPTDEEVAAHLGIGLEEYGRDLLEATFTVMPLGKALSNSEDGELTLSDVIPDESCPNPSEETERVETLAELAAAIRKLPERDQLLISLYYHEELTLKEISHVLGVSESRVCQLHSRAVTRLRAAMSSSGRGALLAIEI